MLGTLREQTGSYIMWAIFAIIIIAFVANFGPQANENIGCGAKSQHVLDIDGEEVSIHSWRFYKNLYSSAPDPVVLDFLIQRTLLVNYAAENGIKFDRELVKEQIMRGDSFILGGGQGGVSSNSLAGFYCPEDVCNFDLLESAVQRRFGMQNISTFVDQQIQEFLAKTVVDSVSGAGTFGFEEARAKFRYENDQVTFRYLRFYPEFAGFLPTTEEVGFYANDNEEKLKTFFEENKESKFFPVPKQIDLSLLFIKKPTAENPDDLEKLTNKAKQSAESHCQKAQNAFGQVAFWSSEHYTSRRGGRFGWYNLDNPNQSARLAIGAASPKSLDAIIGDLEVGKVSPVVETSSGWACFLATRSREGERTFENTKLDLAEIFLIKERGAKNAKAAAEEALKKVLSKGKTLEEVFEKQDADRFYYRRHQLGDFYGQIEASFTIEAPSAGYAEETTSQEITRFGTIENARALIDRAFASDATGVWDEVIELDGLFYVIEIVKRDRPNWPDYEKEKFDTLALQSEIRGPVALGRWIKASCESLKAQKKIRVNPTILEQTDPETGKKTKTPYTPCTNL